jgi:hypothetical protein
MSIPFIVIGLVLFVNRKRLKDDFKANPNAWWRSCFWFGLPVAFLSACFAGGSVWGQLATICRHAIRMMSGLSPFRFW